MSNSSEKYRYMNMNRLRKKERKKEGKKERRKERKKERSLYRIWHALARTNLPAAPIKVTSAKRRKRTNKANTSWYRNTNFFKKRKC